MAGNFIGDRPGDLRSFGRPNKEGRVERDVEEEEVQDTEQEDTSGEEYQGPVGPEIDQILAARDEEEEQEEKVAGSEEEEEEEDQDEHQALLSRVRERDSEPAAEETTGVSEQEFYTQKGRLEALEEQIKSGAAAPQPEVTPEPEEAPGINYQDPAIVAAIRDAVENPERLGPTIQAITEAEVERAVKSAVDPIQAQIADDREVAAVKQAQTDTTDGIEAALQQASKLGGLEAAIVADARENLQNSFLYEYLGENPHLATSPQGIVTGVISAARVAQLLDEREPSEESETVSAPALSSGRRATTASQKGRKLKKPKSDLTPEEEIKKDIVGQVRGHKKLKFMMR